MNSAETRCRILRLCSGNIIETPADVSGDAAAERRWLCRFRRRRLLCLRNHSRNSRSKSNHRECSTRVLAAAVYISKFNQLLLANGFLFSSALPRI
jgi:hypothetical protein